MKIEALNQSIYAPSLQNAERAEQTQQTQAAERVSEAAQTAPVAAAERKDFGAINQHMDALIKLSANADAAGVSGVLAQISAALANPTAQHAEQAQAKAPDAAEKFLAETNGLEFLKANSEQFKAAQQLQNNVANYAALLA